MLGVCLAPCHFMQSHIRKVHATDSVSQGLIHFASPHKIGFWNAVLQHPLLLLLLIALEGLSLWRPPPLSLARFITTTNAGRINYLMKPYTLSRCCPIAMYKLF